MAEQVDLVTLQSSGDDSLECFVSGLLAENPDAGVASIQGMVQPACFTGSQWSWHAHILTGVKTLINES